MLYCGPSAEALLVYPLDTFTAVFHRPSGTTHLLTEPAPQILTALAGGPSLLDDLLEWLSSEYDVADADRAALAERLAELVAAGLVAVV